MGKAPLDSHDSCWEVSIPTFLWNQIVSGKNILMITYVTKILPELSNVFSKGEKRSHKVVECNVLKRTAKEGC